MEIVFADVVYLTIDPFSKQYLIGILKITGSSFFFFLLITQLFVIVITFS